MGYVAERWLGAFAQYLIWSLNLLKSKLELYYFNPKPYSKKSLSSQNTPEIANKKKNNKTRCQVARSNSYQQMPETYFFSYGDSQMSKW